MAALLPGLIAPLLSGAARVSRPRNRSRKTVIILVSIFLDGQMKKLHFYSRVLRAACLAALLFSPFSAVAQKSAVTPEGSVNPEVLQLKIDEVEASTSLDEQVAGTLLDLYRRALTNLEMARVEQANTQAVAEAAANAPAEMEKAGKALEELRNTPVEKSLKISDKSKLPDLEQALSDEKVALSIAEPRVSELREQYIREVARPGLARERLSAARQERDAALEEANAASPVGEAAELSEARHWSLSTRAQKLTAEMRSLEQDLLTHDIRLKLLEINQEYASLNLERIRTRARMLEDAISARRGAEAELARKEAETAKQELETQHPSVRELAEKNVELGKQLTQRGEEIQEASDQRDATRQQLTHLGEELDSTTNKLAIAGVNQALGQLLIDQRNALPKVQNMRNEAREREIRVADVGLQQIDLGEQRRELRDIDAYVADLTRDLPASEAEPVREELKPLAESRSELVEKAIDSSARYLSVLGELHLVQRQFMDAVHDYRVFLDSKLLWVRNSSVITPAVFLTIPDDVKRLFSKPDWKQFLDDFVSVSRDKPWAALLFTVFLVLGILRRRFLTRIDDNSRYVGRISKDRFSFSIKALIYTLLASAPLGILVILLGVIVNSNDLSAAFSISLATTLVQIGLPLVIIMFAVDACREHGLLRVHCRWTAFTVEKLHKEHLYLLMVLPVAQLLGEFSYGLDRGGPVGGVAVLGVVIAGVSLAVYIFRLFIPEGGILQGYLQSKPGSLLQQTRPLWTAMILSVIPALLILWLAGYNYTGYVLAESFLYSFWLILWLMILQSLLARWLVLGYERLELKAAIARRDAAREARRAAKESPEDEKSFDEFLVDVDQSRVDYEVLGSNSRMLLRMVMIFAAAFWLWLIWAPIFPALGVLEEIALWSHSIPVSGQMTQVPVTLADLLFAIVLLIATFAAAKGVPALVELALLRSKTISTGGRYTVTTLLRYLIIGVGGLAAIGMLGISWSKAQWLVAALGVGIGFGLQEIVANFISGLVILFERPIRVGDVVTVGETSGVVTRIQIRATTIRDWDRKELLVPNKEFITGRLLNWSLSDDITRLLIPVGVAYGSDVMLAMKLAEEAAREHEEVLDDPAPFVIFEGFGDNALNIGLRAYLPTMDKRLSTLSEVNESINRKFAEAGISIAFPQRDVHLDTRRPLEIRMRPAD